MALLHYIWLYITLPWLYFTLLDSTLHYHGSTSLYVTLRYTTMALLDSTSLYIIVPWLIFTLLDSPLLYHGSTSLYTSLYCILPWLYITLLDVYTLHFNGSTSLYTAFYHSLYLDPHYSTIVLLRSTALYHSSTSLHMYLTLHYSNNALLHPI